MAKLLDKLGDTNYAGEDNYLIDSPDGDDIRGEVALWRAVITQALMDAGSTSMKREMRLDRAQAIAWLSGNSDGFQEVCARAGLDPDYVREKAKKAIRHGCSWRKDSVEVVAARRKRMTRLAEPGQLTQRQVRQLKKFINEQLKVV